MAEVHEPAEKQELNSRRLAAAAMIVSATLLAAITPIWAVARFVEINAADAPSLAQFLATAAVLLAGWCLAALMWGVAGVLSKLEDALEDREREAAPGSTKLDLEALRTSLSRDPDQHLLEQLVELTRELRDIELLSKEDRARRLETEGNLLARQLEIDVPTLLREHRWVEAAQRIQKARLRFPMLPDWDALDAKVAQARSAVETRDVDAVSREINDLMALGAWDRATRALRHLQERHPDAPRVAELARKVALGRDKAIAEERARLMARAQQATNERHWSEALQLVEEVLEKYPDSAEATELRQQLPTLRDNVEIQTRQRMEAEIRDLIKDHHYAAALRIARQLIDAYPDSPQAAVLRDQLPRLEQRAAGA